jgi:hypothetical protein
VGWWKFDEGSGGTASDNSGYGNTGTLTNGPTWTSGKIGSGVSCDGVDDYIEIANNFALNPTSTITVSMWVYPRSNITNRYILYKPFKYALGFASKSASIWNTATTRFDIIPVGGPTYSLNAWHHIILTSDHSTARIYEDGIQVANTSFNFDLQGSSESLGLCTYIPSAATYASNAIVDEVRIYNRALSAAEIQAIYNATR